MTLHSSTDPTRVPKPNRRRLLAGGGAAALGLSLAGAWLWSRRTPDPLDELWTLALPQPDGGTLRLADWQGHALLVNFWATWCAPCLEEMPLLDSVDAQSAGRLKVLGLAADPMAPVQRFLPRLPVRFPVGVAGPAGLGLSRRLGNDKGGLPYSLLIGADGRLLERKTGQLSASELADWTRRAAS